MTPCPWYVTVAALRDWMRIGGWAEDEEAEADAALLALCSSGAPRDTGRRTDSGAEVWRTGRLEVGRRRGVRLELTVMPGPRPEGEKPQLLRVRAK